MVALTQVLTVTAKGQVVLPIAFRQLLSLEAGNKLLFETQKDGVRITRVGIPCHMDVHVKGLITQLRAKGGNLAREMVDPYFGYQLLRRKTGEFETAIKNSNVSVLSTRGQLTIPQSIRSVMGFDCGSKIIIELENEHATLRRPDGTAYLKDSAKFLLSRIGEEIKKGQNITDWGGAIAMRMSHSTGKTMDVHDPIVGKVNL
jgi:antitoxin PrlF